MEPREQKDCRRMIFLCFLLVLALVSTFYTTPIQSQEAKFPSKAIEVIVPYSSGGFMDVGTRIFAESMSRELKVPVVVKNQPGGGGLIGATAFLNTKPDGYTFLSCSAGGTISTVQLAKTPPFDPRKDLLPIAYVVDVPIAMAVPKTSPFKSFQDFLQFAKSNPGKLRGGFSAPGGETHIMYMAIIKDGKIEAKIVPYVGIPELVTALLGEHLDWASLSLPAITPYVKSGDARVLLLTRTAQDMPGVPAGSDIGLNSFSLNMWTGFFTHPQTPKAAYDTLVSAVKAASKDPELIKKLTNAGFNVSYKDPHEFSNLINQQWEILSQIIKETGMKVN